MISTKKYVATIIVLAVLAVSTFFTGLNMGKQGYIYTGNQYSITNQNNQPKSVDYNLLWQTIDTLNQKYIDRPVDQQKVLYGAITGAVAAVGDPYTSFFDPQQFKDFKTQLSGSFDGIGAEVGLKEGAIVIIAPLDDSPAKKAGLLAGDLIVKIDNQDTVGLSIDQAVAKIRGPKGTVVTLTIFRPATKKQLELKITRQKIEIVSVKYEIKTAGNKKIAEINIQRFGDDTLELFKKAVDYALEQKVDGIVLDLRDDPGGYLDGAVAVASYWLKQGDLVVTEARADGSKQEYRSSGTATLGGLPTIVLINGGSASASEIVSGALRDQGKAQLLGTKSFGKGSVQELIDLPQNTALKVTVAKWLTPKGLNINKNGLEPDIKIELTPEQLEQKQDPQMDKALELLGK